MKSKTEAQTSENTKNFQQCIFHKIIPCKLNQETHFVAQALNCLCLTPPWISMLNPLPIQFIPPGLTLANHPLPASTRRKPDQESGISSPVQYSRGCLKLQDVIPALAVLESPDEWFRFRRVGWRACFWHPIRFSFRSGRPRFQGGWLR